MADQGLWFKLWCSADDDPDLDHLDIGDFGRFCKLGLAVKSQGTDGQIRLQPPARTLCAKFQVGSFRELIWSIHAFPGVVLATGPIAWPHGHFRPPTSEGEIICGSWYTNDRGSGSAKARVDTMQALGYGDPSFCVSPETIVFVSFRNWPKYQGDFSSERVRKFRDLKRSRGEEKRRDETRREENTTATAVVGRPPRAATPALTVEQIVEHYGSSDAYAQLDVRQSALNLHEWCKTNGVKPTPKRVTNWLNGDARKLTAMRRSSGNGQPGATAKTSRATINEAWKGKPTGEVKL